MCFFNFPNNKSKNWIIFKPFLLILFVLGHFMPLVSLDCLAKQYQLMGKESNWIIKYRPIPMSHYPMSIINLWDVFFDKLLYFWAFNWWSLWVVQIHLTGNILFRKDFSLRDQLRRSAVSVMANITEEFERRIDKGFAYFLNVSLASPLEIQSNLYVA